MGNNPHKQYREDPKTFHQYSKRDLEIIQQKLRQKKDIRGGKNGSQKRGSGGHSYIDENRNKSLNLQYQDKKPRNVTPKGTGVCPASVGSFDFAAISKSFDFVDGSCPFDPNRKRNIGKHKKQTALNIDLNKKGSLSPARFYTRNTNTIIETQTGNHFAGSPKHFKSKLNSLTLSQNEDLSMKQSLNKDGNRKQKREFSRDSQQDFFQNILESRDDVGALSSQKQQHMLESYYRRGTNTFLTPQRLSESNTDSIKIFTRLKHQPVSDLIQNRQTVVESFKPSFQQNSQSNKFAKRMARHMTITQIPSLTPEMPSQDTLSKDESKSSRSSQKVQFQPQFSLPSEVFEIEGIKLTSVPAMSSQGMTPIKRRLNNQEKHTTVTTETEEEYAVIEESKEYRMSLMRRKRGQQTNRESTSVTIKDITQMPKFQSQNRLPKNLNQTLMTLPYERSVVEIKPQVQDNQFRTKYMQKLSLNRMIDPTGQNKPKSHQSIIIWDWDDTLMCSTYLAPYQSQILKPNVRKKLPKQVQQQLDTLEVLVTDLLRKSAQVATTYIITNAGHGWVELSAARFMPKLFKEMISQSKKNGINIISARALHERQMPNAFKEWKQRTFNSLVEKMDKDILTNIVAIGDSQIEIDAANNLQFYFDECCIKTVKLKEQPNLVELIKQVELIQNQFEEISSCAKNLTIRLQKVQDEEEE